MAATNPGHNASDIKPLDATRHRLLQLANALASLRRDIEISDPLPPWSTILTTSHLLSHHLTSLTTHLSTTFNPHSDSSLSNFSLGGQPHAYPLPSFPFGTDKENILGQLLRKKLDPDVEEWIDGATTAISVAYGNGEEGHDRLSSDEQEELWAWAKPRAGEIAAGIPWGIDYSIAERESGIETVVTGLKRTLDAGLDEDDDDGDDDDEDEDVKMEDQGVNTHGTRAAQDKQPRQEQRVAQDVPMLPLDELLRFASAGAFARSGVTRDMRR